MVSWAVALMWVSKPKTTWKSNNRPCSLVTSRAGVTYSELPTLRSGILEESQPLGHCSWDWHKCQGFLNGLSRIQTVSVSRGMDEWPDSLPPSLPLLWLSNSLSLSVLLLYSLSSSFLKLLLFLSANPHIVSFLTTLSSLLPIKAVHSLCLPEFFSFSLASNIILYFLLNISSELFFFCLFYYHGPSVNSIRGPSRLFPLWRALYVLSSLFQPPLWRQIVGFFFV